ncbi:MAG TPA: delta-60 repeat domain-containing protein [Solirubrobacterales bacterium]
MTLAGLIRCASPCALAAVLATLAATPAALADNSMSVQPDGKIVLAGAVPTPRSPTFGTPALVRLNPDGSIDTGFAADGGLVDFRGDVSQLPLGAVATTANGIFSAVGYERRYRIARFQLDGDVDSNFGVEGAALSAVEPQSEGGGRLTPSAILPLADGTIVVGGSGFVTTKIGSRGYAFADVLRSDGSLSASGGTISGHNMGGYGTPVQSDLVRTPSGSLVMAGTILGGTLGTRGFLAPLDGSAHELPYGPEVGRFPADSSFEPAEGKALASTADGFVAVGSWRRASLLAGFTSDLERKSDFGEGGIVNAQLPGAAESSAESVAVQPDGKIVIAGEVLEPCQDPSLGANCWGVFLGRFGPDGKLDQSFGKDGYARTPIAGDSARLPGQVDLALLADGSILLSASPQPGSSSFQVARFTPSGTPDGTFGQQGGVAVTSPCEGTVAEQRKSGCFSHAYANLHLEGLAKGKPRGRLRLTSDNLLDPMASVAIVLPKGFRGLPKAKKRLRVVPVPRVPVRKQVKRGRLVAGFEQGARGLTIGVRPGIMRRVRRVAPGHKLVFRVQATFKDGSTQRIPVRVAP